MQSEEGNAIPFEGGIVHPNPMEKDKGEDFMREVKNYKLDNLETEAR